jgi:proline dehydrogenase
MSMLHSVVVHTLPWVPKPIIRRIAGRYIAGESREGLLRVVDSLHAQGYLTTVDVLGENVTTREEAQAAAQEYSRLIEALSGRSDSPQISVKLTLLGLRLDEGLANELLTHVIGAAEAHRVGVYLDMEDSSTTDAILKAFRASRARQANVGVAIQAYLRRSQVDLMRLLDLRPSVRICKGIYNEPASIALKDRMEIRESFLDLVRRLREGGGFCAIATHDPWLLDRCLPLVTGSNGGGGHEFQMLLGVGDALRPRVLATGSRIRLYCPYGPDWYAYSLRRLRENPHMASYIAQTLLSRKLLERGHLERE